MQEKKTVNGEGRKKHYKRKNKTTEIVLPLYFHLHNQIPCISHRQQNFQ